MLPADLDLLTACGRPSLKPDGALGVTAVTRPDLATDAYVGSLWAVPTDGGSARRLTHGPRDSAPAVSPDGRRVAFLRGGRGEPPQVHLTSLGGGEPVALTDDSSHPLGAGAPVWSPDGSRLAYAARVPEPGRYGAEDGEGRTAEPAEEPARLITELRYRRDSIGFTRDRREHLFVLEVPPLDGEPGSDLPTCHWRRASSPRGTRTTWVRRGARTDAGSPSSRHGTRAGRPTCAPART